jgi:sugar phosphate isomerase/epimerase
VGTALRALAEVGYDDVVSIEHDRGGGLTPAALY